MWFQVPQEGITDNHINKNLTYKQKRLKDQFSETPGHRRHSIFQCVWIVAMIQKNRGKEIITFEVSSVTNAAIWSETFLTRVF